MSLDIKYLKYPLYLFLALLLAKIGYVFVESYYNYHVLVTTTSKELSRASIEELNLNGHRISSVGITLLIIPFFYFFVKLFSNVLIYISVSIFAIVSYFGVYYALNIAIDKIVVSNKEKRYDAYYVDIFKYGILNNIFAYNSFIDNDKVINKSIDVNDRILLANTFLLLYTDEKLIEKLKQRGKESLADVYITRYKNDEYEKNFEAFKQASREIETSWVQFNDARKDLSTKVEGNDVDEIEIKKNYNLLKKGLKEKYKAYKNSWKNFIFQYNEATHFDKLEAYKQQLTEYFKYQSHQKAQDKYRALMEDEFEHYVKPEKWLNYDGEVTHSRMKEVIKEEMLITAKDKSKGVPRGLTAKEFVNHISIKLLVAKELKSKGMLIPLDFDYTYSQFKKYYLLSMKKGQNRGIDSFYSELKNKIGDNDLKLSFDWNDFINSSYIRQEVTRKLNDSDPEDISNIIKAIESKDFANFKEMVYLPKIMTEVNKIMYTREDFKDGGQAEQIGDDAIKLLYIPPFALLVSIIALLLNIVTVVGMLIVFFGVKTGQIAGIFVKLSLYTVIVMLPFIIHHNGILDNKLIQKASSTELSFYIDLLNWLSYYEQMNAELH